MRLLSKNNKDDPILDLVTDPEGIELNEIKPLKAKFCSKLNKDSNMIQ